MAPRAIASGTISFGLVSVPVKLFSGTQSKSLSFNMLHAKDHSRLKQQYVCQTCGEVVERDATVRGYEYAKDQYAVLGAEELKALDQQSDQSIEIEEFVPIASVDPIYFEKTYLLGPDKGGNKAYRLLREAMRAAGRGAVARFSTRGRQQLVLLREAQGGLMMHALFYADEVRDFSEVERGDEVTLKPGELELAVQLIEQLASSEFDPKKYKDEYREQAMALIEKKVAGEEIAVGPARAAKGQIIDLMEALKASLASRGAEPAAAEKATARRPARAKSSATGGERVRKSK
ncbi:MAG TPA: Ku protein [Candidatus Dormibacteraeota bacterium]|nr:Ku protein [Candidatus Dormibacteraeota bacterium]